MNSRLLRLSLFATLAVGTVPAAMAIEPIPSTPGWRGFVLAGVGFTDLTSNVVAGNGIVEIGDPTISSIFQRPQGDSTAHPVVTGEVNYTFASGWQAFFGTSLEDAVTLDGAGQLGLRREFGGAGTMQAGLLMSAVPVEVWSDPYAEGVRRETTDRGSQGLRLQWDRILGSAAQVTVSWRSIEIDRELSGTGVTSVACDADCVDLLRRDGDFLAVDASWLFRLGANRNHLLRPQLRYTVDDRDGEAISGDGWRAQLSYVYAAEPYTFVGNVAVGGRNYDEQNPLYGRRMDSDQAAVDLTLFYRLPTESGRWQAVGGLLWGEDDSDVDFHDSEATTVTLGLMYRFGAARSPMPEAALGPKQ
jgi:hypothetical protein